MLFLWPQVEPDWRVLDQFVVSEVQMVFGLDALQSSHPVSIEVGNPDEINEIFDRISYAKGNSLEFCSKESRLSENYKNYQLYIYPSAGASIIRMMDHFLTTPVFTAGLTSYLRGRSYSSATQNDLWAALTVQARQDRALPGDVTVKDIMDTWTLQTGYPVVTVTRDYAAGSARLEQRRFLLRQPQQGATIGSQEEDPLW